MHQHQLPHALSDSLTQRLPTPLGLRSLVTAQTCLSVQDVLQADARFVERPQASAEVILNPKQSSGRLLNFIPV